MKRLAFRSFALLLLSVVAVSVSADQPPAGFQAIFDGKTLDGWHGRPHFSPTKLAEMSEQERKQKLDQ